MARIYNPAEPRIINWRGGGGWQYVTTWIIPDPWTGAAEASSGLVDAAEETTGAAKRM